MPYLMGYLAMPLERLTMLVIPQDGEASLIIPRLEGPRVHQMNDVFTMVPWNETEDPVAIAHTLLGSAQTIAVGDQMWSRFLVDLLVHRPNAKYVRSVTVMEALRSRKDAAEIAALVAAGAAADRVAAQLHAGDIPMVGRTEAEVSADISARLIAEGHQKVNFAIVAAGENAASPHHHAGDRVIQYGEIVLCDFGGTMNGYCSDITRCVHIGDVPQDIADAYAVLLRAQAAGVSAGVVGSSCENVDAVTRAIIDEAGYGEYFVHRTGHGIGMEEHEDPYMVSGNTTPIAPGHAYSVEPGIYVPGKWGMRLEDIVVATENGPMAVNHANHQLVVLNR
jgi:Xaa-Pro aminopeptidase